MRDIFNTFPTVEEEIHNVINYYNSFTRYVLFKKLAKAFFYTSAVGWFLATFSDTYYWYSFSCLCMLTTIIFLVCTLIYNSILSHIDKKSFQLPTTQKEYFNVTVNSIFDLLKDDKQVHETVKKHMPEDERLTNLENARFSEINSFHFFMWENVNKEAYMEVLKSNPSREEMEEMLKMQKSFKEGLLTLYANIPDMCKEVEKWYSEFEQKVKVYVPEQY